MLSSWKACITESLANRPCMASCACEKFRYEIFRKPKLTIISKKCYNTRRIDLLAISSLVFESVELSGRNSVVAADVEKAADELVELNANYHAMLLRGLSEAQKALVLALAREPTREFDEAYRSRHGLPASSTVHSALKELIKDAIVEDGETAYGIGDPVLSRYVRAALGRVM